MVNISGEKAQETICVADRRKDRSETTQRHTSVSSRLDDFRGLRFRRRCQYHFAIDRVVVLTTALGPCPLCHPKSIAQPLHSVPCPQHVLFEPFRPMSLTVLFHISSRTIVSVVHMKPKLTCFSLPSRVRMYGITVSRNGVACCR